MHDPNFNRFRLIHTCDGQTDGRAMAYTRYVHLSRVKIVIGLGKVNHEAPHILDVRVTCTTLGLRDLDPHTCPLEKKLDSFHLRCQRRILHISWDDFVSNDEVLHRTGLFDVSYIVRKRRLGLFGHVATRQTSKRCSGKLDPPNLCQDEGW